MRARLGDTVVAVESDVPFVLDTIAEFYPTTSQRKPTWTVTAERGTPPPEVQRNGFGVGVKADIRKRWCTLWAQSERDLAVTARKVVREIFLADCEPAGYTMVHASAIYTDEQVVVFAADKRGGKTTLALRAVLDDGWRWLSNDHLIVVPDAQGAMTMTSLPTPIPIKVGTLVDLWERLPAAWDGNDVDIQRWRAVMPEQRYCSDDAAYFTFARFGQPNPVLVPLAGRHLTVVFPHYAAADSGLVTPSRIGIAETAAELAVHLRTDWIGDERLHQRVLPFAHRDVAAFRSDGLALTGRLAEVAGGGWRWAHRGHPGPLLDRIRNSGGAR
ncbi:hypothetical protein Aca07nite_87050 [Actinoplanes capillaceus]|uniref:Uncharacterized protein n=1 Tax=Actinoplanes campanulatus TaxID=113559 RepID=A0ABQ3WYR6_9ACTN|nr:hypothetical protein [Actinoplanes capillaceus]GID51430.1 hypothetical protein Aca07nite_87050 [Actinoplanes capillaceus]